MPDLRYTEVVNLLRYFGTDLEGEGSPQLKCRNRAGRLVIVHCHPGKVLWHDAVMKKLRDLGVSRSEFDAWLNSGRKGR